MTRSFRRALGAPAAPASVIPALLVLLAPAASANGQARAPQQVVNPAPVNYWMDVSTGAQAGGGGMLGGLMSGMMGGMGGGGAAAGGDPAFGGQDNWFGAAQLPTVGRFTDIAVFDRRRPGQVQASQAIPTGMGLGATLPLLPPPPPSPRAERSPWDEPEEPMPEGEMPTFTIKLYWGCGAQVRQGQPRTVTISRDNPAAWGSFMAGRSVRDRGATSESRSSIWPNRTSHPAYRAGASLQGDHRVSGAGLPASLAFRIGAAQDSMPPMNLSVAGRPNGPMNLSWQALPTAAGYFVNASGMSMREGQGGRPDEVTLVMWSASEQPDPGSGLLTYLSNDNLARFQGERVVMPASQTACAVPTGIFAEAMMVNFGAIAYGRELNLVYPDRPSDPRVPWNQEWTARVRVKSQTSLMMMPGMASGPLVSDRSGPSRTAEAAPAPHAPVDPSTLPVCRGASDARTQQAVGGTAEVLASAGVGGRLAGALFGAGRRAREAGERREDQAQAEVPGVNCRAP
jgi:hypothetical protein